MFRVLVLLLVSFPALSLELSAEMGRCKFGLAPDGTFYQSDKRTNNYMTPRCVGLYLSDKFGSSNLGWRVGVLSAGAIQARENIATLYDEDAFQPGLVCNDPGGLEQGRGCNGVINGSGRTWGIPVSLTYDIPIGRFTVTPELGLFFFRHRFYNDPEHSECTKCGAHGNYEETSPLTATPSKFAGLMLRYRSVYLSVRQYSKAEHRALSLTDHSFRQVTLGIVAGF
jgi:hypothetical protein